MRVTGSADAFPQFSASLVFEDELRCKLGNGLVRKLVGVLAVFDIGIRRLGPLYNARGCQSCHLKDGRARNLTEAVLWHGGEAQRARDGFVDLSAQDRAKLIRFLESLH